MPSYEEMVNTLTRDGARVVTDPSFVLSGSAAFPDRVSVPGTVPPEPKSSKGPEFFKGEDIVFVLPSLGEGRIGKLSVGYVVNWAPPVFEKLVPVTPGDDPVVVRVPGKKTREMTKGTYLWDFFTMKPDGSLAVMVASGTLNLHETVGARTLYSDPTEEDSISMQSSSSSSSSSSS